jgi:GTP-binding protein HflX
MLDSKTPKVAPEKAFLVGVQYPDQPLYKAEALLAELGELVKTLGLEVAGSEIVRLREAQARLFIGSGRAEAIIAAAKDAGCGHIILDEELSPGQQRNWEKESGLHVADRQEIILDIFADRAQTKEASLQVELARMEYALPRLKRAWTHLSRQRGGGVNSRGQGETQLEADQRLVRNRIARVRRELVEVVQHRKVQRNHRTRVPIPTAALVGYTNAGKSSLLNRLTSSEVLAQDKLFATLDPTSRRLDLPNGKTIVVTDTVGFIRKLPHRLIEAFKATLEEAMVADYLIHIMDVSCPDVEEHEATTLGVLKELGLEDKPIIKVFNKVDKTTENPALLNAARLQHPEAIFISTHTGEGLDTLQEELAARLVEKDESLDLLIPHSRWDLVHFVHERGVIAKEEAREEGMLIRATFAPRNLATVLPFRLEQPELWLAKAVYG